ncbi:pentapeptide repeat-containing protein [Streptomyces sp. ATCC 21386]|uniref:pentapeptide repeat-containing protein n=1 Tax=Streptomyces sp. ATCC 21386 TaxID=2699428 RepID=UPI001BFF55B8|nr:pentapeptide repeat-containing protein [Streptomyces sp. ATCC 21386]
MVQKMTEKDLPEAIRRLFESNNYRVRTSVHVYGAEVDLIAEPKGDAFASLIYIEATVQHVDNTKYGKDLSKLAMIQRKDPRARLLIISSVGFTASVLERAAETGVECLTYEELFRRFEKFEPYISYVTNAHASPIAKELSYLSDIYQPHRFRDGMGTHSAVQWLEQWRGDISTSGRWLVTVGEYGTGKTALTKVLQYRWTQDYIRDPSLPIPFRIELRNFTRQFDARGLLHYFLDHNELGHVPIDFAFSLIRSGRVVLLLDGYDEMAQYLKSRERRECLRALAELADGGAKGILTSRPNYFTEAEELQVFDTLYRSLRTEYLLTASDEEQIEQEKQIDEFIRKSFLERSERSLQDLDRAQTRALVERQLHDDPEGQRALFEILDRVFREEGGKDVSLSGKPVIVSYLLEVVEQLKADRVSEIPEKITEWYVYKLIIGKLMMRDLQNGGELAPEHRRRFLQSLAVRLSERDAPSADEATMRSLIRSVFSSEIRRLGRGSSGDNPEDVYFNDLRRSSTLTRSSLTQDRGWAFSHNSLREFLVTEYMLNKLVSEKPQSVNVPISEAMQLFAATQGKKDIEGQLTALRNAWLSRSTMPSFGALLALLWEAGCKSAGRQGSRSPVRSFLEYCSAETRNFSAVPLRKLNFSTPGVTTDLKGFDMSSTEISECVFEKADCAGVNFSDSILESTSFKDADLSGARFTNSDLIDIDLTRAKVAGADFRRISRDSTIIVTTGDSTVAEMLTEAHAIGYLNYHGAQTDEVGSYYALQYHPYFFIVEKICTKMKESSPRQRQGVEQRGVAQRNVPFARRFIAEMERCNFISAPGGRLNQLVLTPEGRNAFARFVDHSEVPEEIERFLRENP